MIKLRTWSLAIFVLMVLCGTISATGEVIYSEEELEGVGPVGGLNKGIAGYELESISSDGQVKPAKGKYMLKFMGTADGSASVAHCYLSIKGVDIEVTENTVLSYYLYVPATSINDYFGIDFAFTNWYPDNLRDSHITDQNGVDVHPYSNKTRYGRGKWYRRIIPLGGFEGKTITAVGIAWDTPGSVDEGKEFIAYFDEIEITEMSEAELKKATGEKTAEKKSAETTEKKK